MGVDSSTSFGGSGEQREARLLRDALSGDHAAFCELVDVAAGTAFALLGVYLTDQITTRRVFVDLLAEAHASLADRDPSVRGWTWICRRAIALADEARAAAGWGGPGVMFSRREGPLARTVGELPPATGAMLYLRYGAGCSVLDIARVFEVTTAAVSQRLYDAVDALDRSARSLDPSERSGLRPNVGDGASEEISNECRGARRRLHSTRDRALEASVQIETREHLSRCQACLNAQTRLEFAESALTGFLHEVSPSPRRLRRFLRAEAEKFPVPTRLRDRVADTAKRVGRRILRRAPRKRPDPRIQPNRGSARRDSR